jgi:hypothetical protein
MAGRDHYREAVISALSGFQLIESTLKLYISMHYDTTRLLLKDRVHFDFQGDDLKDAALGRLVTVFSKLNRNTRLVARIRELIKHRDEIAHQALVQLFDPNKGEDDHVAGAGRMFEITNKVGPILDDLQKENELLLEVLKSV